MNERVDATTSSRATQTSVDLLLSDLATQLSLLTALQSTLDSDNAALALGLEDVIDEGTNLAAQVRALSATTDDIRFRVRETQANIEDAQVRVADVQQEAIRISADAAQLHAVLLALSPAVGEALDQLETERKARLDRRLEAALADSEINVIRFQLPAVAGGELERTREILIATIVQYESLGAAIDEAQADLASGDTAFHQGRYQTAWLNAAAGQQSAVLTLDGSVATEPEGLALFQFENSLAGNPLSKDYIVTTVFDGLSCSVLNRLAFEADLDPFAFFPSGSCGPNFRGFATDIQLNGQLGIALARQDRITLRRVDLPALIETNSVSVAEGDPSNGATTPAVIGVSLSKPHPNGEDVQVSYFTRSRTANSGLDYALTQDTVTFSGASGETVQTITIPVLPDTIYEDDELFDVELDAAINAFIRNGDQTSVVTILDDDVTPDITPDCDSADATNCRTIAEPGPGSTFPVLITLTMAEAVDAALSINYATSDGSATAGVDYLAASGSVQIDEGTTTASIGLTVLGDDVTENTETFQLTLSAPASVSLVETVLNFHILDDAICFLEADPTGIVANADGGAESVEVTALSNCTWSVSSPDSWITITSPTNNMGSGTVMLTIDSFDPPAGVFTRNGSLDITLDDPVETLSVTVDQDGDCSFTIDDDSEDFPVAGGMGSFNVDASVPECDWAVSSSVPWVTILSPTGAVTGMAAYPTASIRTPMRSTWRKAYATPPCSASNSPMTSHRTAVSTTWTPTASTTSMRQATCRSSSMCSHRLRLRVFVIGRR